MTEDAEKLLRYTLNVERFHGMGRETPASEVAALHLENEDLRAEIKRLRKLQDNGIPVDARACPACGRLTLCLPEGLTCLPCQMLNERQEKEQLRKKNEELRSARGERIQGLVEINDTVARYSDRNDALTKENKRQSIQIEGLIAENQRLRAKTWDSERAQDLARYIGLRPGDDIIDGVRFAWDSKCREHERHVAIGDKNTQELVTENDALRAADHADPRASEVLRWVKQHRAVLHFEGRDYTDEGPCFVIGGDVGMGYHPAATARAAMDTYEEQAKPNADPVCVELLRWWKAQGGWPSPTEFVQGWRARIRKTLSPEENSMSVVCRDIAVTTNCESYTGAMIAWFLAWSKTEEGKLAQAELDKEKTNV